MATIIFFKRKIPAVSNYSIFLFFSVLYSFFPMLVANNIYPQKYYIPYELSFSFEHVAFHLFLNAICLLIFIWQYRHFKATRSFISFKAYLRNEGSSFIFCLLFLLLTVYMGMKIGYVDNQTSLDRSLMSNMKTLAVGTYVGYLIIYGFNIRTRFLLILIFCLLVVESSRWYVTSAFLATAIHMSNKKVINLYKFSLFAFSFLLLYSWIVIHRAGLPFDSDLILSPYFIEGTYGSYMNLQFIDLLINDRLQWLSLFSNYIFDPILYLIPRFFAELLDINKETLGFLGAFIVAHSEYLDNNWAPVGGFYYLAEASVAFPIFGPIIVTWAFSKLTFSLDSKSIDNFKNRFFVIMVSSGFVFVFIKTYFAQTVKYFLTYSIGFIFVYLISRLKSYKGT
jgi:hypothetical protein